MRRILALVAACSAPGCGIALTAGTSMVRTPGSQIVEFKGELEDDQPGTPADVEVSARADNFDMYGLIQAGPVELMMAYGVQLVDVRSRDASPAMPGTARPVEGESAFSDRVVVGIDLPILRRGGVEFRPYVLAGFTAIARELGFGARPMRNYEGGLELAVVNRQGMGMSLRVGLTLENGFTERQGADEFGFTETQRGEYDARGVVVTIGFRITDMFEAFK